MAINRENDKKNAKHCINIESREQINLTGIEEVISYDEKSIAMQSNLGQITLDGEGLNIVQLNLDDGEVAICGKLNALYYMEPRRGGGVFSRLFG